MSRQSRSRKAIAKTIPALLGLSITSRAVPSSAGDIHVLHRPAQSVPAGDIVFIHGGGFDCAASSWTNQFAAFDDWNVWAIDLPGFGLSASAKPADTALQMAQIVSQVLDELAICHPVVVGHSMGGEVTINLAFFERVHLRAMVLVGAAGLTPRWGNPLVNLAMWMLTRLPHTVGGRLWQAAHRLAAGAMRWVVHDPRRISSTARQIYLFNAALTLSGYADYRYTRNSLAPFSMTNCLLDRLEQISCPVLLLHGDHDRVVDPQDSTTAAAHIPDTRLVLHPDSGHWLQAEYPEDFNDDLAAFLARISAK